MSPIITSRPLGDLHGKTAHKGQVRPKLDQVRNSFRARGIANPLEVIERITYRLFMRGAQADQAASATKLERANPGTVIDLALTVLKCDLRSARRRVWLSGLWGWPWGHDSGRKTPVSLFPMQGCLKWYQREGMVGDERLEYSKLSSSLHTTYCYICVILT